MSSNIITKTPIIPDEEGRFKFNTHVKAEILKVDIFDNTPYVWVKSPYPIPLEGDANNKEVVLSVFQDDIEHNLGDDHYWVTYVGTVFVSNHGIETALHIFKHGR